MFGEYELAINEVFSETEIDSIFDAVFEREERVAQHSRSDIAYLIEQHHKLLKEFRHREAKILLQYALVSCIEAGAFSIEVTQVLDALALGCKSMDEFSEAAAYLAQSLAIKRMVLGENHQETDTARARLRACVSISMEDLLDDESRSEFLSQWASVSSVVRCLITKATSTGYDVALIDDGRIGEIYTHSKYSVGDEVEALIAGATFGKLQLKLARKHVIREFTQSAFGKPSST